MSFSPTGQAMCIYGDPAYPHRIHIQCPCARRQHLTVAEEAFNQSMSQGRVSVEWVFGDANDLLHIHTLSKESKARGECCWQDIHSVYSIQGWIQP